MMAYMIAGPDCADWTAARWGGNEAHSTMVGVYLRSVRSRTDCLRLGGFKVRRNMGQTVAPMSMAGWFEVKGEG
jgi:hypothetical protein